MRFEEAFRDELAQLDKEAGIRSLGRNALLATALAFGHGGKPSAPVSTPPAATAKSGDSELSRKMSAQAKAGMIQSERAAAGAKRKSLEDAWQDARFRRKNAYIDTAVSAVRGEPILHGKSRNFADAAENARYDREGHGAPFRGKRPLKNLKNPAYGELFPEVEHTSGRLTDRPENVK